MPNRKTPGRDAFTNDLKATLPDVPRNYSVRVLEILQTKGHLLALNAELAKKGQDTHEGRLQYVQNVRKGHTVDWRVLAAFQQLAQEVKKATPKAVAA